MVKQSIHIRVRPIDHEVWKNYCDALGEKSPELFNKVMTSEKLRLNEKIIEELRKKEEDVLRKISFSNDNKKYKK